MSPVCRELIRVEITCTFKSLCRLFYVRRQVVHAWLWSVEQLPYTVPKVLDLLYEIEICSANRCCSAGVICIFAVCKDVYCNARYIFVILVDEPVQSLVNGCKLSLVNCGFSKPS